MLTCLYCLALGRAGSAQNISVFDGATPAGAAPGTPPGASALSGFEHYNPFSGGLSAALPLYHVGGRGEAGVDLVWNFQQTWEAQKRVGGSSPIIPIDPYPGTYPTPSPNAQYLGAAGALYARTGASYTSCGSSGSAIGSTLTTLIFVTGNGTEINLTDQATNGATFTVPNACSTSPNSWNAQRGTAFHSVDGSMLQFTADSSVLEMNPISVGHGAAKISGNLQFPNGTTYRIDNSQVTWIRDRNGNKIRLYYTNGPLVNADWDLTVQAPTTIIDTLGRVTSINYNESSCGGCTDITYAGTGGRYRNILIMLKNLSAGLLRSGYAISPLGQLFPQESQVTYNFDPLLASSIQFPDNRQFTFQYNSFGELARVDLPTSGAVEYDYGDGHNGNGDGFEGSPMDANPVMIYRRLQERREYAAGGSTWTSKTHFTVSYPGSATVDKQTVSDPAGIVQAQTTHTMNGSPLDALQLTGTGCNAWNEGLETQTDWGAPNPLRTVKNNYVAQSGCMNSPQLASQTTILDDTNQQSQVSFTYDRYNNITDQKQYDWGAGAPGKFLRDVQTAYIWATYGAYAAPSINLVKLPFFSTVVDANGNQIAQTVWHYDETAPQDAPGITEHDANYGTGFNVRGNVTTQLVYVNTGGGSIPTQFTYDIAGNQLSQVDPMFHTSTYNYSDPQTTTYAFLLGTTNALGQSTSAAYDFSTGNITSAKDLNGVSTAYAYDNLLDRLTQIWEAQGNGGNVEGQTNYSYPNFNQVSTTEDQNQLNDHKIASAQIYDGLGRLTDSVQYEDSSQIEVHTYYNALGEVASVTNPSRPNDGLGYATATVYDTLGRVRQVTAQDGSVTATAYSGNQTSVTDAAGKNKTYSYDAQGRLTSVAEDTGSGGLNYVTSYGYDELDDVVSVSQGACPGPGCQVRTFTYDSLGHVLTATNPESCTTSYSYDYEGKLQTQTDARGSQVTYQYDALHRVVGKTYGSVTAAAGCGGTAAPVAATPRVQYTYDQGGANSVGHLSKVEAFGQSLTSYGNFDALGRPGQSYQNTNATPYTMLYTYNLAGGLTSETYPSGRTISTGYDAANRVTQMGGVLNGQPTSYVASVSYQPHGGPFKMEYGNQLWRTYTYNQRLQVSGLWDALQDMPSQFLFLENPIGWGGTDNNGTVRNLTLYAGGPGPSSALFSFQQKFTYDGVNRLQSATDTGGWSRVYSYDQFGNRAVANAVGLSANQAPQSFTGANQVSGGSYDAAGNQLAVGGNGLLYDGENRVAQIVEPPGGAQLTYYYDGEGRRIEKLVNGVAASVYVYDALGQMIAEDSPNQSTGTAPCRTCYLSVDHLGSPRLITDANGHVMALHDYLPFGDEVPANLVGRDGRWGPGNDNIQQKFTGQERGETGLDYFGARYYAGALGRFTSPDPGNAGADLYNPQSWNGYSYVGNDPLDNVDPTGTCDVLAAGITMYPHKSSVVDRFAANKIAVFPYANSGRATGIVQAASNGGDVSGLVLGIRAAISQTPDGASVNLFTISGGTQTTRLALNQLGPDELARIGNITYMIPGGNPIGELPTGNGSTSYITGGGLDDLVPSARPPQGSYDFFQATGCGHDAACVLGRFDQFLKNKSGLPCGTPGVITPTNITVNKGTATSTIHYGSGGGGGAGGAGGGYVFEPSYGSEGNFIGGSFFPTGGPQGQPMRVQ